MFVTIQSLKVAGMDEAKLALLISHELSHYLLGHQVERIGHAIFTEYLKKRWFRMTEQKDIYDPVREDFKLKTRLHRYSCYYP